MKIKGIRFKSSLTRRLLSTTLAAAMVIGLLPAFTFSARAADSVEYRRESPEAAILNYYTGNSIV